MPLGFTQRLGLDFLQQAKPAPIMGGLASGSHTTEARSIEAQGACIGGPGGRGCGVIRSGIEGVRIRIFAQESSPSGA